MHPKNSSVFNHDTRSNDLHVGILNVVSQSQSLAPQDYLQCMMSHKHDQCKGSVAGKGKLIDVYTKISFLWVST